MYPSPSCSDEAPPPLMPDTRDSQDLRMKEGEDPSRWVVFACLL